MEKRCAAAYNAPMTAFVKMHGLGNDFVVLDARDTAVDMNAAKAKAIADRHLGVGCDTVVLILPSGAQTDAAVQFFNADGSESEACFNATRCVARLLMDERGLTRIKLSTKGGLLTCHDAGKMQVTLDVGAPKLDWRQIPLVRETDTIEFPLDIGGTVLPASAVSMGNPHCVLFVPNSARELRPCPSFPIAPMSNSPRCWAGTVSACGYGNAVWA